MDEGESGITLQSLCPVAWRAGRVFLERSGFKLVESELFMRCTVAPRRTGGTEPEVEIGPTDNPAQYAKDVARLHNFAYAGDVSYVPYNSQEMARLLGDDAEIWITREEGRMIAYCHIEPGTGMTRIESIVVDPAVQGRGIGTRLACAVLHQVICQRGHEVHLQVSDRNPAALRLYEKLGFEVTDRSARLRAVREDVEAALRTASPG